LEVAMRDQIRTADSRSSGGTNGAVSANDWECSDCRVRVTFDLAGASDSPPSPDARLRPDHWVADGHGWHCLRCQREAVIRQPTVEGAGTPAQQRRRALVQFELAREPRATDLEVARWVKCTSAQVAGIRGDIAAVGSTHR
jgi:hypothetical protein